MIAQEQSSLLFGADEREDTIDSIHQGTAIYTALPEIEALLDRLEWPARGERLLDPGAGNGGFLVAALARLSLDVDDVATAAWRVHGYEFHAGAAASARRSVSEHLRSRGWNHVASDRAAEAIVEIRDFLLTPVPVGTWDVIAANPPYWRYANLPAEYRFDYDVAIPAHARADLLYAYLDKAADIVARGGRIGLVTADRWLLNSGSAELRRRIGERWSVTDIRRLESSSAFYRPKSRVRGTPARVHPVALVLEPGHEGRALCASAFPVDLKADVVGKPLGEIATIRLAPWLGPDGIFMVSDPSGFPEGRMVPCVEPEDLDKETGTIRTIRRWAIRTDRSEPEPEILAHLDKELHRMPPRGRQRTQWLPPEPFDGKLPLEVDAVLVPRIATTLRAIPLPAGTMPVNHNLVVVSGMPANDLRRILEHPLVREQADSIALRLENGYHSYTATLLRALVIPDEVLAG
jgi:hypothetical protein